jgi:hypothetical protein
VQAQGTGNPGNNAVFNSSSACCIGSTAFIDAFILAGSQNLCTTIYDILKPGPQMFSPRSLSLDLGSGRQITSISNTYLSDNVGSAI